MIVAIAAHLGIGLGALMCQTCGKRFCRHRARGFVIAALLLAEATASVVIIDNLMA